MSLHEKYHSKSLISRPVLVYYSERTHCFNSSRQAVQLFDELIPPPLLPCSPPTNQLRGGLKVKAAAATPPQHTQGRAQAFKRGEADFF